MSFYEADVCFIHEKAEISVILKEKLDNYIANLDVKDIETMIYMYEKLYNVIFNAKKSMIIMDENEIKLLYPLNIFSLDLSLKLTNLKKTFLLAYAANPIYQEKICPEDVLKIRSNFNIFLNIIFSLNLVDFSLKNEILSTLSLSQLSIFSYNFIRNIVKNLNNLKGESKEIIIIKKRKYLLDMYNFFIDCVIELKDLEKMLKVVEIIVGLGNEDICLKNECFLDLIQICSSMDKIKTKYALNKNVS